MSDSRPQITTQSKSTLTVRIATVLGQIQRMNLLWLLLRRRNLTELIAGVDRTPIDLLVEKYVLAWTLLALALYPLSFVSLPVAMSLNTGLATFIIVISTWRIIEIVTFYLNFLVSHVGRPGGVPTVASYERSFVLMLANYIEITVWFAVWYSIMVRRGVLDGPAPLFFSIFRESLSMMLVNTSGLFTPKPSRLLWAMVCFQSITGLFMTVVVVARTLSILPIPKEDSNLTPP